MNNLFNLLEFSIPCLNERSSFMDENPAADGRFPAWDSTRLISSVTCWICSVKVYKIHKFDDLFQGGVKIQRGKAKIELSHYEIPIYY